MRHRDNDQFRTCDPIYKEIWKAVKLVASMDAADWLGGAWKFAKIAQGAIHLTLKIIHESTVSGRIISARLDEFLPGLIEEAVLHSLRS